MREGYGLQTWSARSGDRTPAPPACVTGSISFTPSPRGSVLIHVHVKQSGGKKVHMHMVCHIVPMTTTWNTAGLARP